MAKKSGGMLGGSGFESPFPGDNKSCYSNEGVGPYSQSYPRFSDQDGMRNSRSGDGDESYRSGAGEPTGETYPTMAGRGFPGRPNFSNRMPGGGGAKPDGTVPGKAGLPRPYGRKDRD